MKSFLATLGSALIGLIFAASVYAAPEQVPVEVEFVDSVSITGDSELKFGLLNVSLAGGETVIIAPDDSVTDASNRVVGGKQRAADLTVTATASQSITILVDTIVSGAGYTLASFVCKYDTGADTACDGAGYSAISVANATLKVGVTLTGNGSAVVGVDNGSFNVTVSYQ
jgi:hypothetical protein